MEVHIPRAWDPSTYPHVLRARPRDKGAIESKFVWVIATLLRREWAANETGDSQGYLPTSYRLMEHYVGQRHLRRVLDELTQHIPEGCPGPILERGMRAGARGNLYKYREGECTLYRVARWARGGDVRRFALVESYGRKYAAHLESEYIALLNEAPHLQRTREILRGCRVSDGWVNAVRDLAESYESQILDAANQYERDELERKLDLRIQRRQFSVDEVNGMKSGRFMYKRGSLGNRLFHPLVYLPRDLRPFIEVDGWGRLAYVDLRNSQPLMLAAVINAAMGRRSALHDFAPFQELRIPHPAQMTLAGLWDVDAQTGVEEVDLDVCRAAMREAGVEYAGVSIPDDGDGAWRVGDLWFHISGTAYTLEGSNFIPTESPYPGPLELVEAAVGPEAFARVIDKAGGVRIPEEWDFIEQAEAGVVYEALADEVAKATGEAHTRQYAKGRWMDSVAYHDTRVRTPVTIEARSPSGRRINYRGEWEQAFHHRFPEAFAVCRFIKSRMGHTQLVRLLQQVEALVFVDLILGELEGEGIPVHDGFIIPEGDVPRVLTLASRVINEQLGVSPEFTVQLLTRPGIAQMRTDYIHA